MTASIPLAKGWDLTKMDFPAWLSIKHDGVPIKLTVSIIHGTGSWTVVTRSDKPCPSVHTYCAQVAETLLYRGAPGVYTFVAEVTHKTLKNFKDVSGVVRKKTPQPDLILNVFDFVHNEPTMPFGGRRQSAWHVIKTIDLPFLKYVHQTPVCGIGDAAMMIESHQEMYPDAEGFILVSGAREFKPNSRHWDYQKIVVDPTADLRLHSYEEAESKDGQPLGMVGRLNVWYKGEVIGVGPGKMSHEERAIEWDMNGPLRQDHKNRIMTVKYKRDDSYDALRQPTFQHWREDKDEPNV